MTKPQTSAGYFKSLNIVFITLLGGQIAFAVISWALAITGSFTSNALDIAQALNYAVSIFYLIVILGGYAIFRKRIGIIKKENELAKKMNAYRSVYILRFTLFEFATLFAITAFIITGAQHFLLYAGIGILAFLTLKLSKEKLVKELELSSDEIEKINDPEAMIVESEAKR